MLEKCPEKKKMDPHIPFNAIRYREFIIKFSPKLQQALKEKAERENISIEHLLIRA